MFIYKNALNEIIVYIVHVSISLWFSVALRLYDSHAPSLTGRPIIASM